MLKIILNNIGMLFTGKIQTPFMNGPLMIVIENGKIAEIGGRTANTNGDKIIDVNGMTVCPGLIDSHAHPVFGDFTPRQNQIGFIESSIHGGVTSMLSAGEVHLPGRPRDRSGTKALAVLAQRTFSTIRPGGVKVYGGALILEKGLVEDDFKELSEQGVWLVGEIGLGSVNTPADAQMMSTWAKKYGMKVLMHVGGTSIPGSSTVSCNDVLETKPTIVCHLNGGPTSVPIIEARKIIDKTDYAIEIVHCGNLKSGLEIVSCLEARGELSRLIIGNDAPSGTGVIPLGIWRMINFISSICGVPADIAVCCATGNTQKVFELDEGSITVGAPADLQIIDAPMGSAGSDAKSAIEIGDIPGIAAVFVDGITKVEVSRNTPPTKRKIIK